MLLKLDVIVNVWLCVVLGNSMMCVCGCVLRWWFSMLLVVYVNVRWW